MSLRAGAPPDGSHGPHVFVSSLDAPELDDDDRDHLAKSLRVRAGDPITIGDGRGRWRPARFGDQVEPDGDIVLVTAPSPAISIGFAVPKGDRPNLIVQKLTELGVDRIVPCHTRRSVVRWDDERAERHLLKLRRVAKQAAMQSRQVRLPAIERPVDVVELMRAPGVAIADFGGRPPSLSSPTVLIGPEGGWTDEERESAQNAVSLGDHVLRAETAAISAGAVLTFLRGKLVIEHSA